MSKTIKRILIAFVLLLPIASLPAWGKLIWPQVFSDRVCVLQAPDGAIAKAHGVACTGTGI